MALGAIEGNCINDDTHGNSIYLTFFRNHLRGIRAPFENQAGASIDNAVSDTELLAQSCSAKVCFGAAVIALASNFCATSNGDTTAG